MGADSLRPVVPPAARTAAIPQSSAQGPATSPQPTVEVFELRERTERRGRLPGDRYVKVIQPYSEQFRRRASGHLVAPEQVLRPSGWAGRTVDSLRRVLVGQRITTACEAHERIGPIKGLAVFASDNISSSAYASEEIMRVLVL